MRQIVVPLQIIVMSDISDQDRGFERLAVLSFTVSGTVARVFGQTDTGIRLTVDLPVEAVRSAPAILFDEEIR